MRTVVFVLLLVLAGCVTDGFVIVDDEAIGVEQFIFEGTTSVNIVASDTYANVTAEFVEGFAREASSVGGLMTVSRPGRYLGIASVSGVGGNNKLFDVTLGINGEMQENCHIPRKVSSNDQGSWSLSCTLLINTSDVVTLMIENKNDAGDILVTDANVMLLWMTSE